MRLFLLIGAVAALLVGMGMAVSGGIDLCAGPQCKGEQALLESQADINNAQADQTRMFTEQNAQDKVTFRQHWSNWMTRADQAWGGWLKTMATIMTWVGWIIGLGTAIAWWRFVNGRVAASNREANIRGIMQALFAPVNTKGASSEAWWFPWANRGAILPYDQPDMMGEVGRDGFKLHQSDSPELGAARAMSRAHTKRSVYKADYAGWRDWALNILHEIGLWRSKSGSNAVQIITADKSRTDEKPPSSSWQSK